MLAPKTLLWDLRLLLNLGSNDIYKQKIINLSNLENKSIDCRYDNYLNNYCSYFKLPLPRAKRLLLQKVCKMFCVLV